MDGQSRPNGALSIGHLFGDAGIVLLRNCFWLVPTILVCGLAVVALASFEITLQIGRIVSIDVSALLGCCVALLFVAGAVVVLDRRIAGRPAAPGSAIMGLWRIILPMLGLALLSLILGGGAILLAWAAGQAAELAGFVVPAWAWTLGLISFAVLASPVVAQVFLVCVIERRGPIDALEQVVALLGGNLLSFIGAYALLSVAAIGLTRGPALLMPLADFRLSATIWIGSAQATVSLVGLALSAYAICFVVLTYRMLRSIDDRPMTAPAESEADPVLDSRPMGTAS